jgi:hypothetical protein
MRLRSSQNNAATVVGVAASSTQAAAMASDLSVALEQPDTSTAN